jgi:hypothetical protein
VIAAIAAGRPVERHQIVENEAHGSPGVKCGEPQVWRTQPGHRAGLKAAATKSQAPSAISSTDERAATDLELSKQGTLMKY